MPENKIITKETISGARQEIEEKREAINRTDTENFFLLQGL